MNLTVKYQHSY